MATIIASVGDVVTAILEWAAEYVTFITGTPLVLMFVLLPLIYTGVHLLKKLTRV